MNWVGGARKRVKLQGEKKLQKEFFERKRLQAKPWNQFRRSPAVKSGAVSRDLLALQTVSRIQYSDQDLCKPVRKLDLDKFKSTVCGRKHDEVELPPSPNEIPSMINLFEHGCSSNTTGTYKSLPTSSSKSSSFCPRNTSGSEYDTSSSSSALSHLSSARWQETDRHFPHKHMSSQHRISKSNGKILDPFEKDFVAFTKNIRPVPALLKSEKPFNKTHVSKSDRSHQTKDDKISYKHSIAPTQKKDKLNKMTLDPWIIEDFKATPLVRYDTGVKKAARLAFHGGDTYESLKDRGYVSEQPKPTSSHRHKFQCKDNGLGSNKGHDNLSLQSCGLLLDHEKSTVHETSLHYDVYDGNIENRFRDFKPKTEVGEREKLRKNQEMFSFSNIERGSFDMDSRKSKNMRASSPPSPFRQHLVDLFNKRDMKYTFTECLDLKRNDISPREHYGLQILTDYDLILSSGTNGDRRKSVNTCKVRSPQKADVFLSPGLPYLEEERTFKGDHRDPKCPIPSPESSTSSCTQVKHTSVQDELSDFDWELHGSSTVSAGNQATNKDRFKASRISEIFEEMRQLENESLEAQGREDGKQNTAVTPTDKLQSVRQEDARDIDEDAMSEDQLVVSQVVQDLVHKVVLQDSQTITHNYTSRFAIPSRAITTAPWKNFKSVYADTSARTEPMKCHNIAFSQNAKKVVAFVGTLGPEQSMKSSGTPQSSSVPSSSVPSPVNNWYKLDLISPIQTVVLTQECIKSSATPCQQPKTMEEKLLSVYEGLVTTPKTIHINKPKSTQKITKVNPETPVTSSWNRPRLMESSTGNVTRDGTLKHSLKENVENKDNNPETPVRVPLSSSATPAARMKYDKRIPSAELAEMFPVNDDEKNCDSCTQTDCQLTCDFGTSPIIFPSSGKCDAATQYDIENDSMMLNDVEMSMEQGDSIELMDCVVLRDGVLGDKQWTISDTTLDTGSQTDDTPKYSLRSRKKSFSPHVA
ncbi:uncharacterized protein LOC124122049 isoform X1 [Haliotis rufescens]|uniref:uncharacterized protein LOC124122049 isoform X1 n=1 Tax=Haliotis rufescens TaxID=6454 RepID=UPI00201E830D|nr:uncharacterized protein LOC124122049 isoform X1 [Haliotis rufescens]